MKGMVFTEFLEMVEGEHGLGMLDRIIRAALLPNGGAYTAVGRYDHGELLRLVTALSEATGSSVSELARQYGEHLFGRFAAGYPQVVRQYGQIPEVGCLPAQLNQVFLNLLLNAAQAMPGAGEIQVRSGREGERVWIEIEDNGCGIAEEHCSRIFEPFFSTKPVGQGSGLGLAVVFGIVHTHHGELEVHSEIGQGSRFRLWLPIQRRRLNSVSV